MAHMFIQFTPDIPIAKTGQENGEGFEFFPGTDDRIIRACNQKKGQIRVAHVPILFIERCFLQFEQVDKPVCCKNEAALRPGVRKTVKNNLTILRHLSDGVG